LDDISNNYRILYKNMEKHWWKAVRQNEKAGQVPNLRWGHCCAIIEDEVIFFGGYAGTPQITQTRTT
jgi:hypothetical protein